MRLVLVAASLVALVVACSSTTDGDECNPVGTYSMTGVIESTSCKLPDASDPPPSTVQVEPVQATDADFTWSVSGLLGRCPLRKVAGACKYEGRCPITIVDATTANNQGEVLVSWSFTAGGFTGVSTLTAPPFKDNPQGCVQTAKNTATRR